MTQDYPCRHCGEPATVHVALQKGCLVFKDDKDQWLCEHHYQRMSPQGGWWMLEDRLEPEIPGAGS